MHGLGNNIVLNQYHERKKRKDEMELQHTKANHQLVSNQEIV